MNIENVVDDEISSSEVSDFLKQEGQSIDLENLSSKQQLPLEQPQELPLEINEPILPIPLPPEIVNQLNDTLKSMDYTPVDVNLVHQGKNIRF